MLLLPTDCLSFVRLQDGPRTRGQEWFVWLLVPEVICVVSCTNSRSKLSVLSNKWLTRISCWLISQRFANRTGASEYWIMITCRGVDRSFWVATSWSLCDRLLCCEVLASRTADWYLNDFDARVFAHHLQRRSWSRRWDTPSLYGIQQDRASMEASPQILSMTISSLVAKLWRSAGATCGAERRDALPCAGVMCGVGARTCLQSPSLMSSEHYNATLLLLPKNNGITQNY